MSEDRQKQPWYLLFFHNRYLLGVTLVLIAAAGWASYQALPRTEDPVITNRDPMVLTYFPGASAERVEAQVTEPLETALKEIAEIKHVESTSRAGISVLAIELADEVNADTKEQFFSRIRDKIGEASRLLPSGADEPIFDGRRGAVAFTLIAAVRGDDDAQPTTALLSRQAEELADRLRNVPGTDIVRVYGEAEEEWTVTVDDAELTALGLTLGDVARALRISDSKQAAGAVFGKRHELQIEVSGSFTTAARIREIPLVQKDGLSVRVGDVAEVSRSMQTPVSSLGLSDGAPTVFVAARVSADQRVDLWSDKARETVERFQPELGRGMRADVVFDQEVYTSARLGELGGNLFLGALVVMAVVVLTMGWRSSLVISFALPLTAAMTLFLFARGGGELHQMSIFGMIIALGLLIDNAIVVTDEVRKHMAAGMKAADAVGATLRHLFVPLLSSTLTSIFAFMPIMLLPGSTGDFVGSIGTSVVIALASSLVLSLTLIAALAGRLGANRPWEDRLPRFLRHGLGGPGLTQATTRFLTITTAKPLLGISMTAVLSLVGFGLASTLGSQFFPRTDRDMFVLEVTLPSHTRIDHTAALTRAIDARLESHPDITHRNWLIGGSIPSVYYNHLMQNDGAANFAQAFLKAERADDVARLVVELQDEFDQSFPEARVLVKKFAQGPPIAADVEFRLSGPSTDVLRELGEEVRRAVARHPEILHATTSINRNEPKLWYQADEDLARAAGLSPGVLAEQLESSLRGQQAGSMIEGVETMPVTVRYSDEDRDSVTGVRRINFQAAEGATGWAPLSALGTLELMPEVGSITRRDGVRTNNILGFAREGSLPIEITRSVTAAVEQLALPVGYTLEIGGESENQDEAIGNLGLYLPVLVLLTVGILILSFRSIRMAAILIAVGGLSVGYGLLATKIWGLPLSFNTILGSLGLIGLAFNDSIVVLSGIRANPKARGGDPKAIAAQVASSGRHLISTTLTTMGSFLPLLLLIGGDFWPPLAVVLAGGVIGSTLLAFFFVPAAYRLLLCRKRDLRPSTV